MNIMKRRIYNVLTMTLCAMLGYLIFGIAFYQGSGDISGVIILSTLYGILGYLLARVI